MTCAVDTTVPTPGGKFTGKDFEACIIDAGKVLETRGLLLMSHYGTQSAFGADGARAVQSLPDFEGVASYGVQFLIEAKTIERDLLRISTQFVKKRQITHMVKRADYCVPSMLLVLHRERILKTHTVPAVTMVYPVHRKMPWVQECLAAYKENREPEGSIPRDMGFEIDWWIPRGARKPRPDLLKAIEHTRNIVISLNQ